MVVVKEDLVLRWIRALLSPLRDLLQHITSKLATLVIVWYLVAVVGGNIPTERRTRAGD